MTNSDQVVVNIQWPSLSQQPCGMLSSIELSVGYVSSFEASISFYSQ